MAIEYKVAWGVAFDNTIPKARIRKICWRNGIRYPSRLHIVRFQYYYVVGYPDQKQTDPRDIENVSVIKTWHPSIFSERIYSDV